MLLLLDFTIEMFMRISALPSLKDRLNHLVQIMRAHQVNQVAKIVKAILVASIVSNKISVWARCTQVLTGVLRSGQLLVEFTYRCG